MESRAILRHLRTSPKKMKLVADLIRGKKAEEAEGLLKFTNKRGAEPLLKLLQSAVANATNNQNVRDVDKLYVKTVQLGPGTSFRRGRPTTMGRYHFYKHRTCHITLVLESKE